MKLRNTSTSTNLEITKILCGYLKLFNKFHIILYISINIIQLHSTYSHSTVRHARKSNNIINFGPEYFTHRIIAYFFLIIGIAHYNGLRESGGINKGGQARQGGGGELRGNEKETWKTQNNKHSNLTKL